MFWKKNEKLETIKDLVGSRAAYIETVKMLELEGEEKDIFLRASLEVKKDKPDQEIIDKAYVILLAKSYQGGEEPEEEQNLVNSENKPTKANDELALNTVKEVIGTSSLFMEFINKYDFSANERAILSGAFESVKKEPYDMNRVHSAYEVIRQHIKSDTVVTNDNYELKIESQNSKKKKSIQQFCTNCGSELQDGIKFCPECGVAINEEVSNVKNKLSKDKNYSETISKVYKKALDQTEGFVKKAKEVYDENAPEIKDNIGQSYEKVRDKSDDFTQKAKEVYDGNAPEIKEKLHSINKQKIFKYVISILFIIAAIALYNSLFSTEIVSTRDLVKKNNLSYKVNDTEPFSGIAEDYYKNGQIRVKAHYKNGKYNGLGKVWYENGQMKLDGHFKDGEMDGLQKEWYENGQIKYEKYYIDGKKDGFYKGWYENGQIKYEKYYIDDKIDGPATTWWENGQIQAKSHFKDGIPKGEGKLWDRNGRLIQNIN